MTVRTATTRPVRAGVARLVARGDAAGIAAAVAGFAALCWVLRRFVTDDAWISARYAETLATGHGFGWNPSGPRVEGYSNPLLVALEALARLAGVPPTDAARALGVVTAVALLVHVHRRAPIVVGAAAARVALPLIALSPALALWAVGGLETLPAALATTAGVLPLAAPAPTRRAALRAGLALAVLPWLRPEGIVVALAVAGAAELPAALRGARRRAAAVRLVLAAGPALVSQAGLEALRLGIYGHLLPNSVVYKHASGVSLDVAARFAQQAAPMLLVAAVGALALRGRARLLAVAPVVYAVGSLQTVDSVDAYSRFFMPVWPALALLAASGVTAVARRLPRGRRAFAALATVLLAIEGLLGGPAGLPHVEAYASRYATCKQTARVDAAAWLRRRTPPATVFSISDGGLVPAQAGGRPALDQFLLNQPLIQRTGSLSARRRADWLFARRPDVIVLASRDARALRPRYATDAAIARDRRFSAYEPADVARGAGAGCTYDLFVYRARD